MAVQNRISEEDMLELYHNINSVCAQKVRIALKEKGQEAKEHLLTLQGDQNDPAYPKLNPNGVAPTLVHDGNVIAESSLIPVQESCARSLAKGADALASGVTPSDCHCRDLRHL
jgi:hypothetical protein